MSVSERFAKNISEAYLRKPLTNPFRNCRLKNSSPHTLNVLTYPLQHRDSCIESGKLLLDGSGNTVLLCGGRDRDAKSVEVGLS